MSYGQYLGYDRCANGQSVINGAEAGIVCTIFRMFPDEFIPNSIAKYLIQVDILHDRWQGNVVEWYSRKHSFSDSQVVAYLSNIFSQKLTKDADISS